jgi:hypothetical protein
VEQHRCDEGVDREGLGRHRSVAPHQPPLTGVPARLARLATLPE